AQAGMKTGYGLSNATYIADGIVYHGHDGSVNGGHTQLWYISNHDVGYFFSVNSDSYVQWKIDQAIRKYITRNLVRPALSPEVTIGQDVQEYSGWYQPDSPRTQSQAFSELAFENFRVRFANGKMYTAKLALPFQEYESVPVAPRQFRILPRNDDLQAPAPVATDILLPRNDEGLFMQGFAGMRTLKRIPAWMFVVKIGSILWLVFAIIAMIIHLPIWIVAEIRRKVGTRERVLLILPWMPVSSMLITNFLSSNVDINAFANFGWRSGGIFICTLLIGITSFISLIVWWRIDKTTVRPFVRWYSLAVILPLFIATLYLAYWGVIGLRTWA
ncbi:MAG: hypothetical protein ABUL58_00605, partial [Steroidobacter sp.]